MNSYSSRHMGRSLREKFLSSILVLASLAIWVLSTAPVLAGCNDSAGPGVDWSDCRKRNLILTGTDFTGAKMQKTDLVGNDMRNVILDNANLTKALLGAGKHFQFFVGRRGYV